MKRITTIIIGAFLLSILSPFTVLAAEGTPANGTQGDGSFVQL